MTSPDAATPRQTVSPTPEQTIASLNAVIKALVVQYGQPEATDPLSITLPLTQRAIQSAYHLQLTISPQPPDVNPEPWLLLTVEGM